MGRAAACNNCCHNSRMVWSFPRTAYLPACPPSTCYRYLFAAARLASVQVWAGVVGAGPGGIPLQATYKNQGELGFQDAVGNVVLEAAGAIPNGLLVFMPSYSLLDRLLTRWKVGGLDRGGG